MMAAVPDQVVTQVRKLYARLERNPRWMPNPERWVWKKPDGHAQGFAWVTYDNPGLANLLWLCMDMHTPPTDYDAGSNPLWTWVLMYQQTAKVGDLLLVDAANFLSLKEFHDLLPSDPQITRNPLERAMPLMKILAARRMRNEDT